MTDDELVGLARDGDPDAFDQLVVRHQAAVFRATLTVLRVAEDAEEAAQDAFVRAWSRLRWFRGDASFRTWILAIAWNCALSRRRRVVTWLRRRTSLEDAADIAEHALADEMRTAMELRGHIASAIEALSPKLRDALLLSTSGEYEYVEIAAMLGIPLGTVKWRISDARRQVRERLAALGYVDAK